MSHLRPVGAVDCLGQDMSLRSARLGVMLPEAWQVRVSPKGRLTGSPPLYSVGVARDYRAVARNRLFAEELPQVQIVPVTSHNMNYMFD